MPPLCSPSRVLDKFVVDGAVAYVSEASMVTKLQSDTGRRLHAWRDYFLGAFQSELRYHEDILQCQPQDAQHMLDVMQDLLNADEVEEPFKMILEVALLRLAQEHEVYPKHLMLDNVFSDVKRPPIRITVGKVIEGSLNDAVIGIKTSALRLEDSASILSQHILLWSRLRHKNVLPLYGICVLAHYDAHGSCNRLGLVSPFLENGNILEFLEKNPGADRQSFIFDVASGMSYLHENGIVHGRIHCQNILVMNSNPPRACLADFGLTHVISADLGLRYKYSFDSSAGKRMSHLLAPEDNISTNSFSRTQASDVYAFSIASYEILTGHLVPIPIEMKKVIRSDEGILEGAELDGLMWQLMVDCWQPNAEMRPSVCQILERLRIVQMDQRRREEERLYLKESVEASLTAILSDVDSSKRLMSCNESRAQKILDAFQLLLDTRNFQSRTQLIAAMRRLSERSGLYPARFFPDVDVIDTVDGPITSGSFADIYKASRQGRELCLKVIRVSQRSQVDHLAKVFAGEAIVWAQLSHPNVLPFVGLTKFRERLSFVSCWATNGNLDNYLERNPDANRILLCLDTAAGVEYLHNNDIVHGDLKGLNVLVDSSGRASLGDFGLSSVTDPRILEWTSQSTVASKGGTTRWQAPELHQSGNSGTVHNTKASDVFAWANVCYEIFTGRLPFFEVKSPVAVMNKIIRGVTPTRPDDNDISWRERGLNNHIWNLMQDCWKYKPSERLDMTEVISRLDVEKPVDTRPPREWKEDASMRFRNDQGKDLLFFWVGLKELLSHIMQG